MTPKEKAEELVDKFYQTTPNENYVNDPLGIGRYEAWKQAKQCALIAVDEIAKCTKHEKEQFENDRFSENYWDLVKQEIEKI